MNNFDKPSEISNAAMVFGGEMKTLLPPMESIPDEYHRASHPAVTFQQKWFFSGIAKSEVPAPRDGIDPEAAFRHLGAIQGSFEPKHEHKQAAVAYLADKWFQFTEKAPA